MGILSWIIFGLIAGALAKLLMPGKDPAGFFVTGDASQDFVRAFGPHKGFWSGIVRVQKRVNGALQLADAAMGTRLPEPVALQQV